MYNKKLLAVGDRQIHGRRQNRMAMFQTICSHFILYMSIYTDMRDWKKGPDAGCSGFVAKECSHKPQ